MRENKANAGYSLADNRVDDVGEGLRILARMIARRLMDGRSGANGQHSHPGLPSSEDNEKVREQSTRRADGKQAVPPSSCKRLDIPDTLTKEEGSDG